jgi:hypothetical protein
MLRRLIGVVASLRGVAVRHVRMVAALLVSARLVMFGRFAVMPCGVLVVLSSFGVMFCAFVRHGHLLGI